MSYKPGQWLAICDRCGMEFLSGQMQKTWDGLYVDKACFETRHPQDFVHGVKESTIPWSRPEPEYIDISPFDYVVFNYSTDLTPPPGQRPEYEAVDAVESAFVMADYVDDGYWDLEYTFNL